MSGIMGEEGERSVHSFESFQSMHPGHSSRVNTSTSPSSKTKDERIDKSKDEITVSPPGDSRIPRPSGLRRTSSLRMRGERVSSVTLTTPQSHRRHHNHHHLHHHHHHHNHDLHQQHHHQDHSTFPVITENGTDSPRQRSLSLSLTPARPRPSLGHAATGGSSTGLVASTCDSDAESVRSYGSACSTASACDHATFALNGTTWSGRSRKYVVHCSNHTGDSEQYLTPTQRAAKQVRKFQALLKEARKEIEEKDQEIFRLTKEVVELRLYKASLNSPDERTDSSDALTVRENNPFSPDSPSKDLPDEGVLQQANTPETPEKRVHPELPSSLADSGHFEDGSVHSKDSVYLTESQGEIANVVATPNKIVPQDGMSRSFSRSSGAADGDEERRRLVDLYESRIEEMHRQHVDEIQELKQKQNDKVESLLNQLAEVNTRYCETRPTLDAAEARVRDLETELEAVNAELLEQKTLLNDQEERNKQMYLKMYAKGQEAARIEQADQILEHAHRTPPKVTVAELLQQLSVTQAELENIKAMYRRIVEARSNQGALDPEITLQFLKSAVYYFLIDKENHHGHLNAIENILGFTDAERHNIDKLYRSARK